VRQSRPTKDTPLEKCLHTPRRPTVRPPRRADARPGRQLARLRGQRGGQRHVRHRHVRRGRHDSHARWVHQRARCRLL
ncbi:MAG: hypothetical protein AVDCRST_MAG77-5910, partial [uncultured Chloroflexi bacterium]